MGKEVYRDCQRNHACSLGGCVIDSWSEFIRCKSGDGVHCEACRCHRNYHRKVDLVDLEQSANVKPLMSLRNAKRLARQRGKQRKTKFSMGQKEAMREFAESLGWSMRNKGRHEEVDRFCERVGVSSLTFKTWLKNNRKCYFKGTATAACEPKNSPPSSACPVLEF